MRFIFISLLALNLIVAGWGTLFVDREPEEIRQAPVVKSLAPRKARVDDSALEQASDSDALDELAEGVDISPKPSSISETVPIKSDMCELVGAFDDDEEAEAFVERLAAIGVAARVEHLELPAGESFWIHLPKLETSKAAYKKLAELQAQGIESYVIAKGKLENAVSLGVFTFRELAKKKMAELKSDGLDVEMTIMKRTQIETWVILLPQDAEKMSELSWSRALEGMTLQERRKNSCLGVASSENIP